MSLVWKGFLLVTLVAVAFVAADEENYYRPRPHGRHYSRYAPRGGYHGYYRRNLFPRPSSIIDPKLYEKVLSGFHGCMSKCGSMSSQAYPTKVSQSVNVLAVYTSCVTKCAADQMLRVTTEFKNVIAAVYDVGTHKLVKIRKYISGKEKYDVIGKRTRIEGSCCLPKSYFVEWKNIFIPVELLYSYKGRYRRRYNKRMVSVADYLDYCVKKTYKRDGWAKYFKLKCDSNWVEYLEALQRNVGHLVLKPKCDTLAPRGACNRKLKGNPRASRFTEDICVAYECTKDGKKGRVNVPLIKPIKAGTHYYQTCPPDRHRIRGVNTMVIKYRRVPRSHIPYYTLTNGLPHFFRPVRGVRALAYRNSKYLGICRYRKGLSISKGNFFKIASTPNRGHISAANNCPRTGRFEYCNVQQYAGWLQRQLFDVSRCSTADFANSRGINPDGYLTIACLYRVISMKCDCMEAVLNCYTREYKFTTALGSTLGKAASVLCGFILCQKPRVFSAYGGMTAIQRAQLTRGLMAEVGALTPSMQSVPPATFAFLSFGLGMVAFVVIKMAMKQFRKKTVNVEDGYRNLI